MAKIKKLFVCSECGYQSAKWMGKCPECEKWNTFAEEVISEAPAEKYKKEAAISYDKSAFVPLKDINSGEEIRYKTNISELDRVLGGGMVPGEVVLLSGDPGIGKSTLLLQMCKSLNKDLKILYATGEESSRQIKLRAIRLGVDKDNLYIYAGTNLMSIVAIIESQRPDLVIIDSIQTMTISELSSSAGSVTQIRECTQQLILSAKTLEIPIFLVGHVNKDGAIAGPKILEHMVDAVIYFEGERNLSYRIIRAVKNRYGSTNEIGVFEMLGDGLKAVENPSEMLLSGRPENVSGTCVTCVMEGSRPILAEIQALISKSTYPSPKRSANGIDYNRFYMLTAVLEKRCGFFVGNLDIYTNVVGGLKLDETAADLAVLASLISNLLDKPLRHDVAVIGEVGLAGETRSVNRINQRVNEAVRLGFKRIIVPKIDAAKLKNAGENIEIIGISNVNELRRIF